MANFWFNFWLICNTCVYFVLKFISRLIYLYLGIFSLYRLIVGSKESAVTKIITDATPGSDYDQVYRNNFDEDFAITPNKTERMEKLMNEHHATLLRTVGSTTKHQLYQSCQVGIGQATDMPCNL